MKFMLIPALAASLCLGSLNAEDAPAPGGEQRGDRAAQNGDRGDRGDRGNRGDRGGRGNWQERLVKDNPELEGVDLKSEEGQAKLREVMSKRFQAKMEEVKEQKSSELKEKLGFSDEEYEVIKPILDRVESLNLQKSIVLPDGVQNAFAGMRGGNRGGQGGRGGFNMGAMIMGDQEMDPAASEVKESSEALKKLLEDPQVSEDELATSIARVRKAREALVKALQEARKELRSVLTVKQEAILTDSGLLD